MSDGLHRLALILLQEVLGNHLVKDFIENNIEDESWLPSPNQLKYKILIKNKKLRHSTPPLHKARVSP